MNFEPSYSQIPDSTALHNSAIITDSLGVIQNRLQSMLSSSNAIQQLAEIFDITNPANATELVTHVLDSGQLVLPAIEVLDALAMNGAAGAYAAQTGTIYLSSVLFDADAIAGVTGVLTEEIGHHIDTLINGGIDTPGDEGALFRNAFWNEGLSETEIADIRAEDDFGNITLGTQTLVVEQDDSLQTAPSFTFRGDTNFDAIDVIGGQDMNDYRRIKLQSNSTFDVSLSNLSQNANLEVLDSSGQVVRRSNKGGTNSESIKGLGSGDYFFRVFSSANTSTSYLLSLRPSGQAVSDDSRGTARNIGSLQGTRRFSDSVSRQDRNDFYRFSLDETSDFELSLSGLSADANVQLLNESGQVIERSSNRNRSDESISAELEAGDYFVRVLPFRGADADYSLSLTATAATQPDGAGNSRSQARDVGVLNGTRRFQDAVGRSDRNDFYRLSLARDSNFSAALTGLSANAKLEILDSRGRRLPRPAGSTLDQFSTQLDAGDYFVKISAIGGAQTNYSLDLAATAATQPDGAGNSRAQARDVGTLSGDLRFEDAVGRSDRNDFYRLNLAEESDFTAALTGLSASVNLDIFDSRGRKLPFPTGSTTTRFSTRLDAGEYFVKISAIRGAEANYTLNLSAASTAQPDGAGDTRQTARNIGLLDGSRSFQDGVSNSPFSEVDLNDFYRFRLSQESDFSLSLTGLSADADVELLDRRGQVIADSLAFFDADERIDIVLNSGTYFARVFPGFPLVETDYTLNLSATRVFGI